MMTFLINLCSQFHWLVGLQILQFKITMNRRLDFSGQNENQFFVNENRHLKFSTQQTAMKKVNSLRKVETYHPTHRPQIHDLPFEIYPERTKTEISRQQLVERLLDNRREKAESLRAEKIRKQEGETESCTFKPAINAESKRLVEKEGRQDKQAFQRLYECGISRMKSLNDCTSSTANIDKQNCTFHPNIGEKTKQNPDLAPIYERFYEILAEKREAMKALQEKQKETQLKDRPQVSEKSKAIVQKNANFKKNVLQRLFDHMKEKSNNLQRLAQKREVQITKECTFQPAVGYCSNSIIQESFLDRQEKEAIKLQQKMRYIEQCEKLTFVPKINKLSSLLVEAQRQGESEQERLQRMHAQPLLERQIELQKIQQQIYRECTFHPQINVISKQLQGQPHSHKCNCHPKEEQYLFKPAINEKSRVMAERPKHKKSHTISPADVVRKELQYKEMKECTFKPKTLGDRYKQAIHKVSLDQIPGASSYKVRVEKVKNIKKQEQQLKQKLFHLQKRYEPRDHTKAQPFNLSKIQPKLHKLKETAEQQFKKQHPFRPQILSKVR